MTLTHRLLEGESGGEMERAIERHHYSTDHSKTGRGHQHGGNRCGRYRWQATGKEAWRIEVGGKGGKAEHHREAVTIYK